TRAIHGRTSPSTCRRCTRCASRRDGPQTAGCAEIEVPVSARGIFFLFLVPTLCVGTRFATLRVAARSRSAAAPDGLQRPRRRAAEGRIPTLRVGTRKKLLGRQP